jgi:hypothetical protein
VQGEDMQDDSVKGDGVQDDDVQGDGVQGRNSRFRRSLTGYGGGAEEPGAQWCMLVSYSTECP